MERYTKQDKDGRYYIESANGKLESDIRGHTYGKAIDRLAEIETKSEWISVDERLPEKGQEVLAYRGDFRGDMMNTYTYLGTGNWEDDYGYRGSAKHEGITHWMPLPEPPKGV
jgi:hypothetical protein